MNRSTVSKSDYNSVDKHNVTPVKAKIREAVKFCEAMNISFFKKNVFDFFNVSHASEWNALNEEFSRRLHNSDIAESRDRKFKIFSKQIREMKRVLETKDIETRDLIWEQLEYEIDLECSDRTIKNVMRTMNYHKCLACKKRWVNQKTAQRRKKWAKDMLAAYSKKKNWYKVRFSDEIHFEYEAREKLRIIRKSDQRYCQDCLQETSSSDEKDVKRQHCWATVSHNFKSNIYFYEMPDNTNEKMSQQIYIDFILKLIVLSWIDFDQDFVLKENGDSNHDTERSNIVRTWKRQHELDYYFNCSSSFDLSSIENCWLSVKQHVRKYSHWDDTTLRELIVERWNQISMNFINKQISSMLSRLQTVIDGEDKMTDY